MWKVAATCLVSAWSGQTTNVAILRGTELIRQKLGRATAYFLEAGVAALAGDCHFSELFHKSSDIVLVLFKQVVGTP